MKEHAPSRSKQKKELYKLLIARSDVFSAHKTCTLLLNRVKGLGDELYAPLFHAAVISYGRPFVDNKSTGVLSKHWGEFQDSRLKNAHARIIKTRHELVAHSDLLARPIDIIPAGAVVADQLEPSAKLGIKITSYYYPRSHFIDMHDTCVDLISRLTERTDLLLSGLYDNLELPSTPFRLVFDEGV